MRYLQLAAWGIFCLDVVVLAQLLYGLLPQPGGAVPASAIRGLAVMLGSALAGIGFLLIVSTRLRSRGGLWLAAGLGAVPLFFAINAILESMWE